MGGRAAKCQVYPPALCKAICQGIIKQKEYETKHKMINTGAMSNKQLSNLVSRVRKADEDIDNAYKSYRKYSASG